MINHVIIRTTYAEIEAHKVFSIPVLIVNFPMDISDRRFLWLINRGYSPACPVYWKPEMIGDRPSDISVGLFRTRIEGTDRYWHDQPSKY